MKMVVFMTMLIAIMLAKAVNMANANVKNAVSGYSGLRLNATVKIHNSVICSH